MKIAKVVANPYAALDVRLSDSDEKIGIPQGVVALPGARGIWLGARTDEVASARTGKQKFYFPLDKAGKRRVIDIQVDDANVRAHIARAILDGSLIAADEKTAREVGISQGEFLKVDEVLALEKAKALETLRAFYGPGATLDEVPLTESTLDPSAPAQPALPKGKGVALSKTISLESQEGK